MRILKHFFIYNIFAALCATTAWAVPAKKGLVTVNQKDGTTIQAYISGDETSHTYRDAAGRILVWKDGKLVVAPDDFSPVSRSDHSRGLRSRALPAGLQSGYPGLMPGSSFPLSGSPRALVILVEYADVAMNTIDPSDYFTRMLTEPGFRDYNATGSALDYFTENSRGKFTPQFDVVGPVKLSRNRVYYGGNSGLGGADQHPEEMILEACQLIDDKVDFSVYDTDGDGYVDNVFVFYAGRGENDGGGADTVWPHASNITNIGEYRFDGVLLDYYACTNEWQGNRPDGIGTFIHEFSHVMGLPDLYATDYTTSFTPGPWSVMDEGTYNNNSRTPPGYSAFERYALGWLTPTELADYRDVTLLSNTLGTAAIVNVTDTEFYILENRRRTGWDAYIPGEGMLIWHVDYDPEVWYLNTVNNDPDHQCVDIIEADGRATANTRSGDSFPGSASITRINQGGLHLEDIAEDGDFITFCNVQQSVQPTVEVPADVKIDNIAETSFTVSWKSAPDNHYFVTVTDCNDKTVVLENAYAGQGGSFEVTGLTGLTDYSIEVLAVNKLAASAPSAPLKVTTADVAWAERTPTATDATEVGDDNFTANWLPSTDADGYILDVFTYQQGETVTDVLDFSTGTQNLPKDWSSSTTASYSMTAWAGQGTPSLRLGTDGDYLQFTCDNPIEAISFWHRGNGTGADDRIILSGLTGSEWTELHSIPVITEKGGQVTDLSSYLTEGLTGVRLSFSRNAGSIAIDDVTVAYPGEDVRVSVDGYPVKLGDVDHYTVEHLTGGEYFYTIKALNGEHVSKESEMISVGKLSSIITPGTDVTHHVEINGNLVIISGLDDNAICTLTDIAGRVVARGGGEQATLSAPAPGAYILTVGTSVYKLLIH